MVLHRLVEVREPLRVESTHVGFRRYDGRELIGGALRTGTGEVSLLLGEN